MAAVCYVGFVIGVAWTNCEENSAVFVIVENLFGIDAAKCKF